MARGSRSKSIGRLLLVLDISIHTIPGKLLTAVGESRLDSADPLLLLLSLLLLLLGKSCLVLGKLSTAVVESRLGSVEPLLLQLSLPLLLLGQPLPQPPAPPHPPTSAATAP